MRNSCSFLLCGRCLAMSGSWPIRGVLTIYQHYYQQASGLDVISASKLPESCLQIIYLKPGINTLVLVTFKSKMFKF